MVRDMRREDCPAVAVLWREVLNIPTASEESVSRTFEKMNGDSRYRSFVAEEDGRVVGFITMAEVLPFDDPDGYIKINGLAVLPDCRHRGIGRQLVSRVEDEARKRGADSIGLASIFRRTDAHAFYEQLSYQKSAYWFYKNF